MCIFDVTPSLHVPLHQVSEPQRAAGQVTHAAGALPHFAIALARSGALQAFLQQARRLERSGNANMVRFASPVQALLTHHLQSV